MNKKGNFAILGLILIIAIIAINVSKDNLKRDLSGCLTDLSGLKTDCEGRISELEQRNRGLQREISNIKSIDVSLKRPVIVPYIDIEIRTAVITLISSGAFVLLSLMLLLKPEFSIKIEEPKNKRIKLLVEVILILQTIILIVSVVNLF